MLVYRVEHIPCKLRHGPYNASYDCYSVEVKQAVFMLHFSTSLEPIKNEPVNARHSGFTSVENLLRWFGPSLAVLEAHGYRMALYKATDDASLFVRPTDGHVLFPMDKARCLKVFSFANLCEYVPVRPALETSKIV